MLEFFFANPEDGAVETDNDITILSRLLPESGPRRRSDPRGDHLVTHVVLHFMSNVENNVRDPYQMDAVRDIFINAPLSAHYLIDRKGHIIRLVAEDRIAWHAGKGRLENFPQYENQLNRHSIGIELLAIGSRGEMVPRYMTAGDYDRLAPSCIGFTDHQYRSLNRLLPGIFQRHPGIIPDRHHIVGHQEYAGPAQRPENPKTDPGSLFDWGRVVLGP